MNTKLVSQRNAEMNLTIKFKALQCKKVQPLGFPFIRQKIFALLFDKNHLLIISFL